MESVRLHPFALGPLCEKVSDMPKVLVADDALFTRKVLREILEAEGCEVVEASNGKDAVEKFRLEHPDLVLLDVSMPDMDGLTALRAIKESDGNAKVVMVSAMGQTSTVKEALKLGACDFIVKPFRTHQIRELIARWLFEPARNEER
jgi:two-component system chemotaxis response regulator CheY